MVICVVLFVAVVVVVFIPGRMKTNALTSLVCVLLSEAKIQRRITATTNAATLKPGL